MGLLKRVISGILSLVLAVSVMQFPILSVYAEGEPTTAGTDEGLNQSDTAAGNAGGSAAYSMNQNMELPSSTPNSSNAPSSIASSEPESGSTSVTDNRDIAKAENFVTYQVFKEETTTGTETHPEDQVNVSDDKVEAAHNQAVEGFITRYMEETGATREEAEAWWQNHQNEANKANEEAKQKREEIAAQREEEEQAFDAALDQWYLENTGMTYAQFSVLPLQEKTEWIRKHPDVDFSMNPQHTWDWQYQ